MYCMYAVLDFHWKPCDFAELGGREKAFVIACIDEQIKANK